MEEVVSVKLVSEVKGPRMAMMVIEIWTGMSLITDCGGMITSCWLWIGEHVYVMHGLNTNP